LTPAEPRPLQWPKPRYCHWLLCLETPRGAVGIGANRLEGFAWLCPYHMQRSEVLKSVLIIRHG
jgi:hypothetical protein